MKGLRDGAVEKGRRVYMYSLPSILSALLQSIRDNVHYFCLTN